MRNFGGFAGLGRVEVSGEGGMVGGVLVSRGFAGGIALPVQNRPPDGGLSVGNRFLLVFRCFVVAE